MAKKKSSPRDRGDSRAAKRTTTKRRQKKKSAMPGDAQARTTSVSKKLPSVSSRSAKIKSRRSAAAEEKPAEEKAVRENECVVVGVGASAEALDAYRRLLVSLPADTGVAFVLVQHLDASHESIVADLLSKYTSMPVVQVDGPTPIRPDCVYMSPPGKFLKLQEEGLALDETVKDRGLQMPIDDFFRSLAVRAERGVCVVLSGSGTDGTLGLKEVKAAGGMTIAQTPETAQHEGMPRSAVHSGMVDFVVPIGRIPALLAKYVRRPYARGRAEPRFSDSSPDHFESILSLLKAHTDYDFRCYKKGTVNRRIQRRMGLRHVGNLTEYLQMLREDSAEVGALFEDLLIGVTRFFRDKEAWQMLQEDVLAKIVAEKQLGRPVRVWVAGCATGEEGYSLAIALLDELERQRKNLDIQLFGTDLDDRAIDIARSGVYPASIAADISANRLERYFLHEGDQYRVNERLRESTVFTVQNLVSESPLSNLDLISCRNLLIYFEQGIQKKLSSLFHFAIRDGGFLFLGSSESVMKGPKLFEPVSSTWRIYRKVGRGRGKPMSFPIVTSIRSEHRQTTDQGSPKPPIGMIELARKSLLDNFAPPSVLIDPHHEVYYFHGALEDYLSVTSGEPPRDLLALVPEGLRSKLRRLVRRATRESKSVSMVASTAKQKKSVSVRISATPVAGTSETPLLLISFADEPRKKPIPANEKTPTGTAVSTQKGTLLERQLQYELQATREDLQGTIEELETLNEELNASNEEVMSMNEELQFLNEELSTVNNQLKEKIDEVESTNNDISNLLTSTEIATIFLDADLRIRRSTPSAANLLNIIPGDEGRPIGDLSPRVHDDQLLEDAQTVLEKLAPIEQEVRSADGRSFMRRILPYRTDENKIDGVVLTFTDITRLQSAHHQLEVRERQQAAVARFGQVALASSELEPLFELAPEIMVDALEVPLAKVLRLEADRRELTLVAGKGWDEGLVGGARVSAGMDSQAGYTLQSRSPIVVEDLSTEERFHGPPLLAEHGVVSGLSVTIGPAEAPWGVLGAHSRDRRVFTVDDVNFLQNVAYILAEAIRRRESEQAILDRERRLDLLTGAMPVLIAYCDTNLRYRFCNAQYESWFGLRREEIVGKTLREIIGDEAYEQVLPHIERVLSGEEVSFDQTLSYRHGPPRDVHISYIPHRNLAGKVIGYYAMIEDITERVKAERARARLAAIVEHSHDAVVGKDLNGIVTSWNAAAERMYGYTAEEMVGKPIALLASDDVADEMVEILARLERGEPTERLETVRRRKDGTVIHVLLSVSPVRGPSGEIVGASSIAHDTTDSVRAKRELEEWAERLEERVAEKTAVARKRSEALRELAGQVVDAEQRARRRLAQSIHDDLQQVLVAAKMRVPPAGETGSPEDARIIGELLDDGLEKTRALVTELSPPVLEDGSLTHAFDWLARHTKHLHGLTIAVEYEGDVDDVDRDVKTLVFEIARELLFNIVKHAGTEEASLALNRSAKTLTLRVSDSGRGFDPAVALERLEGFGLLSARERAEAFGGHLEIESAAGRGATFLLTIPMRREAEPPRLDLDETTKATTPPPLRSRRRDTSDGVVRILVVDDHQMVREGLVGILSSQQDMEVVGEASDGAEAVAMASELEPSVVLMDISMPRMNGIEATRKIVARIPYVTVIGLSLHDETDLGSAMKQAGAVAFLRKDNASQRLIEMIRSHSANETT